MESELSDDFKEFFLITFTEELIRHSATQDISRLKKIIELKEKNKTEIVPEIKEKLIIKPEEEKLITHPEVEKEIPKKIFAKPKIIGKQIARQVTRAVKPTLFIPEPKLPEHLEYLKPIPNAGIEIDLWKLNPLIKDPAVRIIEVNPDEKVIVTGAMGTRQTGITLNKEDIDRVINKFSELSKIPTNEGIYKVAVGNLIISAIISEVVGSKFIIRKMAYPAQPYQFPQQNNFR